MRVGDLLGEKHATLITVDLHDTVERAVHLLTHHTIGALAVVAGDTVVGLVAERDVVRAVHEHQGDVHRLRVQGIMRPAPICQADESLETVMRRMTHERERHLVVQEGGRTIGIISVGDLVKHRLEQLETETGVLRDYVAGQRAAR